MVRPGWDGGGNRWPRPDVRPPGPRPDIRPPRPRPDRDRPIVGNIGDRFTNTGNIGNRFTNIDVTQNNISNVVNRPIINRPTNINRSAIAAGGAFAGAAGYYGGGGYYPPAYDSGAYAAPTDYGYSGYAPMYGSVGYGAYPYPGDAYSSYHEDWRSGVWSGLTNIATNVLASGALAGGIGLAAAQPVSQTVVYANPYQQVAAPTEVAIPQELDYSKPITPPTATEAASSDDIVVKTGMKTFEEAREAMKKGNFAQAQELTERAIGLVPKDTSLHEFRALCQFAQAKYTDAAATLYAVLSTRPGFDWNTVASLYPSPDLYSKHLHALEEAVRAKAKESPLHFLLAYHYMVLDERQAALEEFTEAARLNDKDEVSKRMAAALEPSAVKDATKPNEK